MEFGILNKFLPASLRSDKRAVDKFKAEVDTLKKEIEAGKKKNPKRIALVTRRQYIANMQQDELKIAVDLAKNPDRPRRDLLYSIYQEVWDNDGHTIGETRKAILKVIGSPFGIFKKGSQEIDESATRLFQKKWFEDYRRYFQEASFFGHSLVQFDQWVKSQEPGVEFEVKSVFLFDREHVRPEEGFIVLDTSHEIGIPFRDERFKRDLMLIEMGDKKSLGLLRVAAKEYIWKNYSRSDWSRHSEKFGMPFIQIKTDTTNEKELNKTEDMAANFGSNLWYVGDHEDEIEIKEATFKDSYQIYLEIVKCCNSEVSKAVSGATGTSDEKAFVGGAEVHERILNEFTEANKRAETYHINEDLFPFLIENGYPLEDKEFRYLSYQETDPQQDEPEATDPKQKGDGGSPGKKTNPSKTRAYFKYRLT